MSQRHLDTLLRPRTVLWIGLPTEPAACQMLDGLHRSTAVKVVETDCDLDGCRDNGEPSVALVADARAVDAGLIRRLAAAGCVGLLWPLSEPPDPSVLAETRVHGIRVLGPRSGGFLRPALGIFATGFPCSAIEGDLALIAQSRSIAAAAMDWATGRHLGFSWAAISGAEADIDVADLLDHAALDPNTRAVAVQLSALRSGRKFMSAARACARVKPVVVLQTQPAARIGLGPDPVRSAAFARAGMVECESLPGLFDALAALQRLPAVRSPELALVGNGAGICALGVDALARQGFSLAAPEPSQRKQLPAHRDAGGAVDLGSLDADAMAVAAKTLLENPKLPALLILHSPTAASSHAAVADRLLEHPDRRLLTVWLGLDSAQAARARCAVAGLATFTSADAAARALRYRWEYQRNRELLTQTPPPTGFGPPDLSGLRHELHQWALAPEPGLRPAVLAQLLDRYGLRPASGPGGQVLELKALEHPELGYYLQVSAMGGPPAVGFPPLDGLLAGRLIDQVAATLPARTRESLARTLVQLAQLVIDQSSLERLQLRLSIERDQVGWLAEGAEYRLRRDPIPERRRLILAPYPAGIAGTLSAEGCRYAFRPVCPYDEAALIGLLKRLDPEEVRLRFFALLRHFSHDMAARMVQIDYDRELSLVLTRSGSEEVVAIATLVADPDNRTAEFALLVHHDHAGRGLGRSLLSALIDEGWRRGIGTIHGVVLAENAAMLACAERLGFRRRPEPEDPGCVYLELTAPRA